MPCEVVSGCICLGSGTGLTALFLARFICDVKKSWEGCERCTFVLVFRTLVMSLSAPTAGHDVVLLRDGGGSDSVGVARVQMHGGRTLLQFPGTSLPAVGGR